MSRFAVPVVSRGGAAAAPARSNARPQISQPVEIGCYARGHTDAAGVAQLLTGPNAKSRLVRACESCSCSCRSMADSSLARSFGTAATIARGVAASGP